MLITSLFLLITLPKFDFFSYLCKNQRFDPSTPLRDRSSATNLKSKIMKKLTTTLFAIALLFGVFAQQNHEEQTDTIAMTGCNLNTPGWGSCLCAVTRGTQEWPISGNGITQIWSDAVTATNCQKTTFAGEVGTNNFNADCRSNPGYSGDLFSWCAVVRFQDQLCPHPWRVPTIQDFIDLDIALGGNGDVRGDDTSDIASHQFVIDNYINRWGGAFGGFCGSDGSLVNQGSWGFYWSSSEHCADSGFNLYFAMGGDVDPQDWNLKSFGRMLRCVR